MRLHEQRERRLRILIITTDFPPALGGIQEWTVQVACQLAQRHKVTVIAPAQEGAGSYDLQLPFRVCRVHNSRWRAASLIALLLRTFSVSRALCPDVILYSHVFAAIAAYPFRRILHTPYLVVAHGRELHAPGAQSLLLRALVGAECCLSVSHATAATLQQKGLEAPRIRVIPNGVSAQFLTLPTPEWCHSWLLPTDRVVLTVSRLDERYKGHDILLRALPLILAQVPETRYVIVGDGRYRSYYEALARSLHVADRVTFTGRVTDQQRLALYDRCSLFAMVSREEIDGSMEGFGIVFLEAAARGRPSVGGIAGGIPDAIEDGVTGYLIDPTDPGAVATACLHLLKSPVDAAQLGAAARDRVVRGFTWDIVAHRIEAELQWAASRGPSITTHRP